MKIAFVGRELSDLHSIDAQNAKEMRFQLLLYLEYLTIKWDIRLELNITENDRGEMKRMSSFVGKKMRNIKIVKLIRSFWMLLMVSANQPHQSFCCSFPILERLFFGFVVISTVLLSEFSCSSFMCIFDILTIVHSFKIFPI